MRENGFDYPLHPLQCLTWALFPVVLLDFYWLLLPLLPGEATRWAVGTVYTAAAATTFFHLAPESLVADADAPAGVRAARTALLHRARRVALDRHALGILAALAEQRPLHAGRITVDL